jgi:hypothetical protein
VALYSDGWRCSRRDCVNQSQRAPVGGAGGAEIGGRATLHTTARRAQSVVTQMFGRLGNTGRWPQLIGAIIQATRVCMVAAPEPSHGRYSYCGALQIGVVLMKHADRSLSHKAGKSVRQCRSVGDKAAVGELHVQQRQSTTASRVWLPI